MEAIRSSWEVPCISHFCHIFSKPFKLPVFEIEELEDTLLLDESKDDPTPSLLIKLYCSLLNGIVDKEVTEENWEFFLKMHLQWRYDYLEEKFNPHDGKTYKELDTRSKVQILHRICHWRMELDDIGDLLRGYDGSLLRVEPLGSDDEGYVYWYFYGTRLYKEQGNKKKKANNTDSTPNKGGRGSRGRGRNSSTPKTGRKRNSKNDTGVDSPSSGQALSDATVDWTIVCSTGDEWEELIETLRQSRKPETKRLCNYLNDELLPDILYLVQQKEKISKRKLLAELPRRTSDRISQKVVKEEEERHEALEREIQREEQRKQEEQERIKMEEEAEKKHQERLEEVIRRRKAREEKQQQQRQKEEQNWSLALSGELSGPRKAAIGAVQGVVQTQHELLEEKDIDLYTDMYKVLSGLRKLEDSWIFEEPVTEDIAPGYFETVEKPMDFQTIEKKIEAGGYTSREQFGVDIELIFTNCKDYNGEDSEYFDLANEMLELFGKLMKQVQQESLLDEDDEEGTGRRKKKKSPSPELTSESSEDSSDDDEGVDEDEDEDSVKHHTKKRRMGMGRGGGGDHMRGLLRPQMMQPNHPGLMRPPHPHMYPPPHMMPPHMRHPSHMTPEMMGGYPPHPYYRGGGPPPPGGRPTYPPHPSNNQMHMRPPPHSRDGPYPPMPPESYRYPYPINSGMPPPPPYGFPPMMTPEQQQQMMQQQRRMMGPGGYHMNGPMMPPSHPQNMPGPQPTNSKENSTQEEGKPNDSNSGNSIGENSQRVSSPRVSSTVKTPPTSGDEKGSETEDTKDNKTANIEGKDDEKIINNDKKDEKKDDISGETDNKTTTKEDTSSNENSQNTNDVNKPPNAGKMPHPPNHHQQMPPYPPHMQQQMRGGGTGGGPPMNQQQQAAMMEERQRYMHAMMIRRQQQYMMTHGGYPPPGPGGHPPMPPSSPASSQHEDPYYNWNRQQMAPGYGHPSHQYSPSSRAAMLEKQRYMEYQMRMKSGTSTTPTPGKGSPSQDGGSSSTTPRLPQAPSTSEKSPNEKKEEQANNSTVTDEMKENKEKSNEVDNEKNKDEETKENTNNMEEDVPDYHDSLTRYARGLASGDEEGKQQQKEKSATDDKLTPPTRPPSNPQDGSRPQPPSDISNGPRHNPDRPPNWPHPSQPGHMMPNGYDRHMMSPHPHYGHMMPPQHMYGHGGTPYGSPQHPGMPPSYPPYQDAAGYGMMAPPDMEQQWRYMEMQRQWMAARQQHMSQQQQPPHQQHKSGLKRPLPNKPIPLTNNGNVNNPNHLLSDGASEKDIEGEGETPVDKTISPQPKKPKLSEGEEDNKTTEDSSNGLVKDSRPETTPVGNTS